MKEVRQCSENYQGYELGPIRPPSEANSLLLRLTRNCPWNKCKFCTLYKGEKFSVRSLEDIKADIDFVKDWVDYFEETSLHGQTAIDQRFEMEKIEDNYDQRDLANYVLNWYQDGCRSIFLQDANSIVLKPQVMVEVLTYLRKLFPEVERITTYGRSQTLAKINDEYLQAYAKAGLNRIHIGMETGNDEVLTLIKKGVDKKTHIIGGKKAVKAGIEVSEYYMPGLGGNEYWRENALDTAEVLNEVNPHFIRIRTAAVTDGSQLKLDYEEGIFTRTTDNRMVEELLLMVKSLKGVTAYLKSDHILNLLPDVEGQLPQDQEKIIKVMEDYLSLPLEEQIIYRIGRRTGRMTSITDLNNTSRLGYVRELMEQNHINENNVDEWCDRLMKRFI